MESMRAERWAFTALVRVGIAASLLLLAGCRDRVLESLCNDEGRYLAGHDVASAGVLLEHFEYDDPGNGPDPVSRDVLALLTQGGMQFVEVRRSETSDRALAPLRIASPYLRMSLEPVGMPACADAYRFTQELIGTVSASQEVAIVIPRGLCFAVQGVAAPSAEYTARWHHDRRKTWFRSYDRITQGLYETRSGRAVTEFRTFDSDMRSARAGRYTSCAGLRSPFLRAVPHGIDFGKDRLMNAQVKQPRDLKGRYYSLASFRFKDIPPFSTENLPDPVVVPASEITQEPINEMISAAELQARFRTPQESLDGAVFSSMCRVRELCLLTRRQDRLIASPLPADDLSYQGAQWVFALRDGGVLVLVMPAVPQDGKYGPVRLTLNHYDVDRWLKATYKVPLPGVAWRGSMVKLVESATLSGNQLEVELLQLSNTGRTPDLGTIQADRDNRIISRIHVRVALPFAFGNAEGSSVR
ncbi:hypothetical protein QLQ15_05020 [Lysobacter sp. LF1]|uniref:Lipoprotein n=1 Tax=Lysobacter stagni TaxID=3045172 RepID=A0ABT6XDP5_9GAMM|nr:hypothetical protein [Lysobacter sp. LF1]MDI9238272.1 hypothetical protein [Lysobacter sp. LF1]